MARAFSFLFFFISLWIGLSTFLSHLVLTYGLSYYFYYATWIFSFFFSLLIFIRPILSSGRLIKGRFSTSISWPPLIKLFNGIAWALPFILIPFFQKYYPFLLLTGLSLGNISTFIFLKKFSRIYSIGQVVTGSLLLLSLLSILVLNYGYSLGYEDILYGSRIMISLSYGLGGIIGYFRDD
jgi:hypothetical protein